MTMHRLSQGGADRVAVLLANGFVRSRIPTRIAVLRGGGEGEKVLRDLLHPDVTLGFAGPPMGSRHLELVRGLGFIRREIASRDPSLVLASSNNMGLVTGLVAAIGKGHGPNYAMKVTNPVVRPRDSGAIRTLYRHRLYGFIFARYGRILTLTEAERQTLAALYPALVDRFHTAANAYITSDMLAEHPSVRRKSSKSVLTLARMMPQKRLDVLLRAFALVTHPGCRLTILGDGPERPALEALALSLGIADRVDMPGYVDDVVPWLRQADLFALSSDYEGLPAALLESLACNLPVVTTDCFNGAQALLAGADQCGVIARGDNAAFARAIDASLAVDAEPVGLRNIARGYTIDVSVAAHIAALRPLLSDD